VITPINFKNLGFLIMGNMLEPYLMIRLTESGIYRPDRKYCSVITPMNLKKLKFLLMGNMLQPYLMILLTESGI